MPLRSVALEQEDYHTAAARGGHDTAYAAGLAAERAKVEAERARTEQAIAAFAALAERLDALAAERSRPWWRRLSG
jgi:hypothetical protein